MKWSYVRLVVSAVLVTVLVLASCDLLGPEDDSVSREDRRDTFLSQLESGRYDRLNGNMHPRVREDQMNTADYWTTKLGSGGGWEFQKISATQVLVKAGPDTSDGKTFVFGYEKDDDDQYFSRITLGGVTVAP